MYREPEQISEQFAEKNTTHAFTLQARLFGSGQLSQERLSPWRSEGPARSLTRVWAGRELMPGVGPRSGMRPLHPDSPGDGPFRGWDSILQVVFHSVKCFYFLF